MRIWSLHPKYLDSKGLVALWRETLLAKNVLSGNTKGYINHSQLTRFKELNNPLNAINYYLSAVYQESLSRGYNFDNTKIDPDTKEWKIDVTMGQIRFEIKHLQTKLKVRDINRYKILSQEKEIALHPLFSAIEGGIASWEKISK